MKILTAIGNPILNEKLQKYDDVFVIGKDIQYQEGVLEVFEERDDIDLLIISNILPEEYGFIRLINEIKRQKEKIDIAVFLKEKDENIENFLASKNIYKIYYLNEIDFDDFINNFFYKKANLLEGISKEINAFKRMILEENHLEVCEENYNYVENRINKGFEDIDETEGLKNCDTKTEDVEDDCQVIAITGNFGVGKSVISSVLSKYISKQNKNTILIDFNLENPCINTIFGTKKNREYVAEDFNKYIFSINENLNIMCGLNEFIGFKDDYNLYKIKEIIEELKKEYDFIIIDTSSRIDLKYVKLVISFCDKIIFLIEPNLLELKKSNEIIEVFLRDWEIDVDKIKIVFNKTNKYKIAESVLEEIFSDFEIIGDLEYEEKYSLFINKNSNSFFEETEFEKIYKNLRYEKEKLYASSFRSN